MRLFAEPIVLALLALSGGPNNDTLPSVGPLEPYENYRGALLVDGWSPVSQEQAINPYREVVCGSASCDAHWSHGTRSVTLVLWPSYDGNKLLLFVDPQYENE